MAHSKTKDSRVAKPVCFEHVSLSTNRNRREEKTDEHERQKQDPTDGTLCKVHPICRKFGQLLIAKSCLILMTSSSSYPCEWSSPGRWTRGFSCYGRRAIESPKIAGEKLWLQELSLR